MTHAAGLVKLMLASFLALPVAAQDAGPQDPADLTGRLSVELNAIGQQDQSCTLTFLIVNGHAAAIDRAVYETVLFDTSGQVERLTLFDFGTLPPARPRVRQFSVPQLNCADLGQILFNGANTCESAALDPAICETTLLPGSRVNVEVQG